MRGWTRAGWKLVDETESCGGVVALELSDTVRPDAEEKNGR